MEPLSAVLVTDAPDADVDRCAAALRRAGYAQVRRFDHFPTLPRTSEGDSSGLHLPDLWRADLFVIDELVRGRSAFELLALLNATPEGRAAQTCLIVADQPADSTVQAAWCAGVDLLLTDPVDLEELERLVGRMRPAAAG